MNIKPTNELQLCIGGSMLLVSIGICCALLSGSVVRLNVAGANLSVNQKLEQVEKIKESLQQSTQELRQEPSVSKLKIEAIERELEAVDESIQTEEKAIADELDRFVETDY